MKLSKKNMKRNKQIVMEVKSHIEAGINPAFCVYYKCPKLIKYGQKIRQNRCEKCEYANLNNRLKFLNEFIGEQNEK